MAKCCEILGSAKSVLYGHKVSHSNRKTKRRFEPNLQAKSLFSSVLGKGYNFRVAMSTLRTIDFSGGLDSFLLKTSNIDLTPKALRLKKLIQLMNLRNAVVE